MLSTSPGRVATQRMTGSATSRRPAKSTASTDGRSSRWMSSTRSARGASSAYLPSRLSVAAPTANRSPEAAGCRASADARASR